MDPSSPAPWTFAGRAKYFGDQVCSFCDHHARAGAKFCDACGSPLHLKPCNQCDAVNDQAAAGCYKCGAEYPAAVAIPEVTPALPADDAPFWSETPYEGDEAATVRQPPSAAMAGGRLLGPGQFFLAYVALILVAGAYAIYRSGAATPDGTVVASRPALLEDSAQAAVLAVPAAPGSKSAEPDTTRAMPTAPESKPGEPVTTPAVHTAPESKPVEPETPLTVHAPIPATKSSAPTRASLRHRAPVPATKHASTPSRAEPDPDPWQVMHVALDRVPVPATKHASPPSRAEPEPDPWQAMHVTLAQCSGDLITRIVCDQRVRRRFCEGHWGEAPECASGVANERGQ